MKKINRILKAKLARLWSPKTPKPCKSTSFATGKSNVSSGPSLDAAAGTKRYLQRDTRLFDVDKLMADLQVPLKDRQWFKQVNVGVREYMYRPTYDASHDYEHIQRVVKEAHRLWVAERHRVKGENGDPLIIFVAAMVHDVGDEKYRLDDDDKETVEEEEEEDDAASTKDKIDEKVNNTDNHDAHQERQRVFILRFLSQFDCPPSISGPAALIASLVSYTREKANPDKISQACNKYPFLKFVQDADRIDALGAMGIARACVYGGVCESRRKNTILTLIDLIDDRLESYMGFMKTEAGTKEAEKRIQSIRQFRDEMIRQADCSCILTSSAKSGD